MERKQEIRINRKFYKTRNGTKNLRKKKKKIKMAIKSFESRGFFWVKHTKNVCLVQKNKILYLPTYPDKKI
jgi:hypothetical protein